MVDFHTWLEACNNFIQASILYHLELTSQLLTYQANICQFAGKYNIADILDYDVLVRRNLANNHSLRWDAIYDSHFEANLKSKTQAQCYYCHRYSHMASACPIKPQGTKKGRVGAKETSTQSSGNFLPPADLKGSVQYSTGVKYSSRDVPTAITNVIDQAVVVTTQANTAPI